MSTDIFSDELVSLALPLVPASVRELGDARAGSLAHAHAVWSTLVEPGDRVAGVLCRILGAAGALRALVDTPSVTAIVQRAGLVDELGVTAEAAHRTVMEALARWSPRLDVRRIRIALTQAAHWRQTLLIPGHEHWPGGFADLGDAAPLALWVRGDAARIPALERAISLVGARASTGYGETVAAEMVGDLVARGFTTVSGGAYGIDACVHRATIGERASTVAVLAGGLDRLYPAGNEHLLHTVENTGALLAEVPSGVTPSRWRFLARNRLIAALGAATVVIEAGARSGSINTAGHAAELGRPLGAVPGSVCSGTSAGCHKLIRDYGATLVQHGGDVAELVGYVVGPQPLSGRIDPVETRVLDALSTRTASSAPAIAQAAGLALTQVEAALGMLDLTGRVARRGSGWVRNA